MPPEDAIRLRHMIEFAEAALSFVQGRDRDALESDTLLAFAVARAIELFGEAASKVGPQTRATTPEIPWRSIVAMRHRLAHAYQDLDLNVVWKTTTEELPPLLPLLRAVLAKDPGVSP